MCEHQLPLELASTHGVRWNKTAGVLWQAWMHPGLTNLMLLVPTCGGKASRKNVENGGGSFLFISGAGEGGN